MAKSMKWKEGWGESPKKKQAQINLEQAAQKKTERRNAIKSGNDIALKKVNTAPNKIKRGLGSLATGAAASVPKMLGNAQVNNVKFQNPLLPAEKQQAVADKMRQRNAADIQGIRDAGKNMFNLKGTKGEEIAYGLGEAIAPIMLPGGMVGKAGKTLFATEGLTKLGTLAARGRQGGAIGLGYTGAAEEKPTAKDYAENAALFGAFDVGAAGLGMAGKSVLRKLKKPKIEAKAEVNTDETGDFVDLEGAPQAETPPWFNDEAFTKFKEGREQTIKDAYIKGESDPFTGMREQNTTPLVTGEVYIPPARETDFTADAFGNIRRGEAQAALPGVPNRLALPGQNPLALTTHEMQALPPGYRKPKLPIKQTTKDGELWYVDPNGEASGNSAYIKDVSTKYNQMVEEEVKGIKGQLGGVQKVGTDPYQFDNGQIMFDGYKRVSLNPKWYRDFWEQNGRAPNAGEYRDMAIKNLTEGNAYTGEPANAEFNAMLSELSRDRKLPDEWHGIQNSIRDIGDNPELQELAIDMKTAQAKVEPYGLTKNLDRLTEIENQARQRMSARVTNREIWSQVGSVGKSNYNPLDDIKDMTIIGAAKIARGTIEFAQWSKEMIDEFGQIIEKQLPGIWKHSNILNEKGETVLKYKDKVLPVKLSDTAGAQTSEKVASKGINPAEIKKPSTVAGEANTVNDSSKQIAALKNHINNAKKAAKYDGNEPARAARVAELEGQLKDLMKTAAKSNKTGYNDISGFQAETQDVARNFKDFYGKDIELQEGSILDNLNTAKGSNIDYQKNWTDKLKSEVVDKLGISKNTGLSKLVQQYGEGEVTLAQLKSIRPNDWQKVVDADSWFRSAYDEILTDVNKTIEQIYPGQADKLVPKRSDYYRHFRDLEGFQGFKNMIGSPANISPELAGRSEFVKPNTKWASFKQQRGLGEFKRDAVGGFLDYLPAASYSVNIDPMVGQFRGLSDQLVKETSGEANTMIRYLQDYANSLAGKTSGWDRKVQEFLEGRGGSRLAMNTITWLNNRAKANSVLLNPGSALSQILNVPNGVAFAKQYSIPGTGKALLSIFKEDAARGSSAFMKERFSGKMYRQFDTKWFNQPKNFAAWMIETADRVGTEMIWQSCHSKGLKIKGIADPVKYADAMTKRLVAGRGIGEMALIQKSKLFQVVAPFQVEVGNLWKIQKDFIKEKDFGAIATLYVGLWLANNMMEEVRGQRIVFDPINAIIEATQEIADPENDAKEKTYKAGGRLAGEILGNVPLGQTMAAAYPEYGDSAKGIPTRKELFGSEDPTRYGTGPLVVKAFQNPLKYLALPFGGAQADKLWQAANTLHSEGSYKNDKLRYPVDVDAESVSKGLLFGPSAMDETKEYYNKNRRPLSENQTKEYQAMVRNGMTPEKAYESIMKAREDRKNKKTPATQKAAATKWKEGW